MTTNAPSGPATLDDGNKPTPTATLVPIDLNDAHHRAILHDQRLLCGWGAQKIPRWAASAAAGTRSFFWICPSAASATATASPLPTIEHEGQRHTPVGHVSLDKVDINEPDVAPDTSLADPAAHVLTITSLFVLPLFRRLGLAAFAMGECERLAKVPPFGDADAVAITVNTLNWRYCVGGLEGPDGVGRWEKEETKTVPRSSAPWYQRRGYVMYKEAVRYYGVNVDGEKTEWVASFLRKEL